QRPPAVRYVRRDAGRLSPAAPGTARSRGRRDREILQPEPCRLRKLTVTVTALAVIAAPFAVPLAAQSPADRAARAVDGRVRQAHLEFLADDALEGRAPGTRGGDLAALYIATQFKRLGLEPAGDSGSYLHQVPVISLDPAPTLTLPQNGSPRALTYRDDFVL